VWAHLLRGEVAAADAPDGELGVAALDGSADSVGQGVGAGEVRGLEHGLPCCGGPAGPEGFEVVGGRGGSPHDGTGLAAVDFEFHCLEGLGGVGELAELGGDGGGGDGFGPFVEVAVDELLHLGFERGVDA